MCKEEKQFEPEEGLGGQISMTQIKEYLGTCLRQKGGTERSVEQAAGFR